MFILIYSPDGTHLLRDEDEYFVISMQIVLEERGYECKVINEDKSKKNI